MRPGWNKTLAAAVFAPGLLLVSVGVGQSAGDEPRGFGRIFRFGGGSASSSAPATPSPAANTGIGIDTGAPAPPPPATTLPVVASTQPTAANGPTQPTQRIMPQARISRPVTDADPILTRVSLVRSNDGNQFGVFLQIFADGTIIDGEGVHHVGRDVLKPVLDTLQETDLYRLKGHCGNPATDFTEYVHLTVYERNFGRLRANAFSYSGNPQGCDHSVARLHAALETLQTKLSHPAGPTPGPVPADNAPAPPINSANSIPLSTPN